MIVSHEVELLDGRFVRVTADVTPCDGVAGELAVDGFAVVVCASWGTPVELEAADRILVEGELVDAAERQIASLA